MIIQKTNPVGLDEQINGFQSYLWDKLGFSDWQMFPRVYMNQDVSLGLIPEYYDSDKDYYEVFYDDRFSVTSFFFRYSQIEVVNGYYECNVGLIFQADLIELFPSIMHRADEEFNDMIIKAWETRPLIYDFNLLSVQFGIDQVYSEFKKDQIKYDDMSNQHVSRYNFRVRYEIACN